MAYSVPAERVGSRRQYADVQHPEPPGLGHVQHDQRAVVGHAGRRRCRARTRTSSSRCRTARRSASLPPFSLAVLQVADWHRHGELDCADDRIPTAARSRISPAIASPYGRSRDRRSTSRPASTNAGLTSYTVTNLAHGHVVLRGVRGNAAGVESDLSNVATKTIQLAGTQPASARSRRASVRAWPSSASVRIDGRRHRAARHRDAQRLRDLAEAQRLLRREPLERRVDGRRGPVRRCAANRARSSPSNALRIRRQVFLRGLRHPASTSSPKKKRLFSAISLSVFARSRCARTMPSSSASSCE